MTGDDKGLTNSATNGVKAVPVTYAANDLRVFVAALERLGYRPDSLLKAAGL